MRERERERDGGFLHAIRNNTVQHHRMRGFSTPTYINFKAVLISSQTKREQRREERRGVK
jgi:hypothetical protein